jgi:hypothetical protein
MESKMENTETLDKTSELATQKLAQIEAEEKLAEEQKAQAESKDAASEESSAEKAKIEGKEDTEKEPEAKKDEIRKDVVILETEDKDLSEPELERKKVLIQEKEDAKPPEQKLKEWQEKTQKRIDGMTAELKSAVENVSTKDATIKELRDELASMKAALEHSGTIESESAKDAKTVEQRWVGMVDEDKDLPREKRREMSDEELDEFLVEEYGKATAWITRRELRRERELQAITTSKEAANTMTKKAEQFFTDYPDCSIGMVKQKALEEEGKSLKEAIAEVSKENTDYALMMKLFSEDERYSDPNNGPDLLAAEMKKRKSIKTEEKDTYTKEEVEQMKKEAIEKEAQRLASLDTGLTNSSVNLTGGEGETELYKQGLKLFITAGKRKGLNWSEQDYKDTLKYGRTARRV